MCTRRVHMKYSIENTPNVHTIEKRVLIGKVWLESTQTQPLHGFKMPKVSY